MKTNRAPDVHTGLKRFTVSPGARDFEHLRDLVQRHRPLLSIQYIVQYAARLLLDGAADEPGLGERLGSSR